MKKPITDWDKFRDQFVRETLRRASFRWPPRSEAMRKARVARGLYLCDACGEKFKTKEVRLDHIKPVVPLPSELQGVREAAPDRPGALALGSYVLRMFPESSGFAVLCKGCHDLKTGYERKARNEFRKLMRDRAKQCPICRDECHDHCPHAPARV
jgi:5-methylcytosine-specific restriction endonuclease McrA